MNPAAEKVYVRARQVNFPAVVLGGQVREGAGAWWNWVGSAPPAEFEQANRQLDDYEATLHETAARIVERANAAADRLVPTEADEAIARLVHEPLEEAREPGRVVTVHDPPMSTAPSSPRGKSGLSPDYPGSDEERRDREAAEALAAAERAPR